MGRKNGQNDQRTEHEQIEETAFFIHRRREIHAASGDLYDQELLKNVDPGVLANRDYYIAEGLHHSGIPGLPDQVKKEVINYEKEQRRHSRGKERG